MTSTPTQLNATPREIVGRKVKQLRAEGKVPANIYKKNSPSVSITLDRKEFSKLYDQAGETTLIHLVVEGDSKNHPVLVRDVQRHPVTNAILHVDFQQVDLKQKVTAMIPVETTGESQAVKDGAVLVVVYNEIEVEALPTDLPEKFEVDLSKLVSLGSDITIADLVFDRSKVSIELEDTEVIATVQAQEEEKQEEVTAEPAEVELTKQGATKEDETAEGSASTDSKKE